MISQNHCKTTQMSYLRQNLHDQVKPFEKMPISMTMNYLPCQCNALFKIHFAR